MPVPRLTDSPQYLKGVGPERAALLARLGAPTCRDLLYLFPRKYHDRSTISKIRDGRVDEEVTIQAEVLGVHESHRRSGHRIVEVLLGDDTGTIAATWFNQPYMARQFKTGDRVLASGKVRFYNGRQLASPEYEHLAEDDARRLNSGGIIPRYPLTEGLGQRGMRRTLRGALDVLIPTVREFLDEDQLRRRGLLALPEALLHAHFPGSLDLAARARRRLAYDELYLLQLAVAAKKKQLNDEPNRTALPVSPLIDRRIRARFSFRWTRAQERVIREVCADLAGKRPMNRLLQGDVGSGKTVVAIYAMLAAVANRTQAALMAPTEILAEQHFRTLTALLAGSKVRLALLLGGQKKSERDAALEGLREGGIDLVVGTHALLQEKVAFHRLALVVIDEQHRFGVVQRADLRKKGWHPHVLVMTATPIPRTLAMTAFGDLDVSTIDEMPPGRKPVKTYFRGPGAVPRAQEFIREKIREGRQAYFVFPLIDESDKVALRSAKEMAEELQSRVFPEFRVALLHGRVKRAEKTRIMEEFRAGKIHILVSTVVIEVGIDVPNATIMVIDHADRYGLATLHQLRGRIGRGGQQSYCILFGDPRNPEAAARLKILEETNDGFRVAEEDLRLRGPGDLLGTRQSGLPELRMADLAKDFDLLKEAREDAFRVLIDDPLMTKGNHPLVLEQLRWHFHDGITLATTG
ncbi:MAG: ATP-dependent DNA helicase RecG [Planctomycetes bacterium]|nr:ATP-dependent DNA helicase RecG [Planctomycetota bacterium]